MGVLTTMLDDPGESRTKLVTFNAVDGFHAPREQYGTIQCSQLQSICGTIKRYLPDGTQMYPMTLQQVHKSNT